MDTLRKEVLVLLRHLVSQLKDRGAGGASPGPTLMELKFTLNPTELRVKTVH